MPAFAVLEPPGPHRGADEHADRFIFLRERFRVGAFLFGPLWMIWHRLWVVLIIYLVVVGFIEYGLQVVGIGWFASVFVLGLVQLLIGLEATTLLHWTRVRHGWHDCGVVIADDLELAERRFFDSQLALRPVAGAIPGSAPESMSVTQVGPSGPDIVGLFPEPGGRR
jgi:Protein of unknown function (DUF2628)